MRRLTFAIIVLAVLAVPSFAASVTVTNTKLQTDYGFLTNAYFETASGPGSSTPVTNTAQTPSGTSGSYSIAAGTSGYLWSPQFQSSTAIGAGSWVFNFWGSAAAYSYVPVTVQNNQGTTTPIGLQVKVTWNPSTFSGYEGSNLGNIRFCPNTACSTTLYAWLESCTPSCTTSATSATAWVRLASQVTGNGGTLTIYMVFLIQTTTFDGNYWGEAPTLSALYGQYDNGANVFNFYDNFAGTGGLNTANWNTASYGTGGTFSTNNMLMITCGASSAYNAAVVEKIALTAPAVAEADLVSQTGNQFTDLGVGSGWDSTTNGVANNGYTISWNGQSSAQFDRFWVDSSGSRTQVASTAAGSITSLPAGIWGVTWYATGNEVAHDGVGNPGSFTEADATVSLPATYVMVIGEASSSGASGTIDVQWARMRTAPPGNTLPSATLGTISSDTASVSIYLTTSTGGNPVTVASSVQSPTLGTSKAPFTMTIAGAVGTVPSSGYISVVMLASSGITIYWGVGQPTDFQVPVRVLT
jgi:hypothetical protein